MTMCQYTGCDLPAKGTRTDHHFRKLLCRFHLALTSRNPASATRALYVQEWEAFYGPAPTFKEGDTMTTTQKFEQTAREIGTQRGTNAASWVELDESAAAHVDKYGVFDVFDYLSGPLSGEWADGYSVDALVADCGAALLGYEVADDLATAYEDAYWQAFETEISRKVEGMLR